MTTPAITEAAFQRAVLDAAHALGWCAYHPKYSIGSDAGYPDLTLIHPRQKRAVWIELKTSRGRVSPSQRAWIDLLVEAGQEAMIAYPDDMNRIIALLDGTSERERRIS